MSLYQDRQIKGFLLFLTLFALLFVGTATVLTIYQVNDAEVLWLKHDEAVSSSLLEQGVPKEVVAVAFTNTDISDDGRSLLAAAGLGKQSESSMRPYFNQFQRSAFCTMLCTVLFFLFVLAIGIFIFFWKRKRLYQQADKILLNYINGDYSCHLPQNYEGAIVLAVFLVTTIFGMADMFIRSQILQAQQESGNWHIAIKNISNEEAAIIASRPDIEVFSPYGVLNYRGDLGYTLGGKDVAICGCDESYITEIWTDQLEEGVFPQTSNEALVTENAKQIMGVAIGDSIAVETPDGDKLNFTISGFMNNTASIMSGDSYGIILNTEDYCAIYPNVSDGEPNDYGIMFFTQFANTRNIQGKIADLKEQCNLSNEQISSNNNLLGLLGQSRVPFLLQVYLAAAVLFALVMLAGIMMIASSLNSNVAQRTEFFGLMRCIGATPKQVMRLVRKEALSWCRLAIPVGISIGIVVIWVLCAILRFLSPEFFKAMPTFGFSVPSILAGIVVGLVTVLFAAYSPAKKAAKVSPLAAVSGNANDLEPARNAANI